MHTRSLLAPLAAFALMSAPAQAFTSDRIGVEVRGSGPDVVLIPGLTSQPRVWASTIAAVPGYRYHLVHVGGFAGRPAGANASGPVEAPVAEEIARYIAETGLRKPAVVGHSMGGAIGLMIAARHPDRVGRLLVVDMLPFISVLYGPPGQVTPATVRPFADKMLADMRAESAALRDARLTAMFSAMANDPAERAAALADVRASDAAVVRQSFYDLTVTDLRTELPSITAPVTVLYVNPSSLPLSEAQVDAVYRTEYAALKRVRLTRVPQAAHFIMADNPERFRSELKTFLSAR